jgi:hypothetical protein
MTTTARTHEPAHDLLQSHRSIWNDVPSLATANELSGRSLIGHLGIEFIEVGDDYLIARMPVDNRTRQPLGRVGKERHRVHRSAAARVRPAR